MRKSYFYLLVFMLLPLHSSAQLIKQHIEEKKGLLQLAPNISVPYENAGYTLVLPKNKKVKGLVVFFNSDRDTVNKLHRYAIPKQLAVVYLTTGNRFEFFFEAEKMQQIEGYLQTIISTYHIPQKNLLFLGMSLAGTRALKQAIFAQQAGAEFKLVPRAIAICDSPIDFVRFWKEGEKAKQLKHSPIAVNEATWVTAYLEKNLEGTPKTHLQVYQNYSPYSYSNFGTGNEKWLRDIAVRAYTEPDVQWWMDNRGKDYYGMNAVDAAALINALRLLGNQEAELRLSTDKGYRPDGSRHPHAWSIVDEEELVEWFARLIE